MCWENPERFVKRQPEPFFFTTGDLSSAQPGGGKGWLIFLLPSPPLSPNRHFSGSTNGASVHAAPSHEVRPTLLKKPAVTCFAGDGRNGTLSREPEDGGILSAGCRPAHPSPPPHSGADGPNREAQPSARKKGRPPHLGLTSLLVLSLHVGFTPCRGVQTPEIGRAHV